MPRALIIGIAGQDGYFLSNFLYEKGYKIHGIDCKHPSDLKQTVKSINIIDLRDSGKLESVVRDIQPDEIYYLAAHHFSSQRNGNKMGALMPFLSVNLLPVEHILQILSQQFSESRFFYAASSHVFGSPDTFPQTELTPLRPNSFYAISKAAALHLCLYYRQTHGLYTSVGILYNHESQRREMSFITTQLAHMAALAYCGTPHKLIVRSLDSVVDWGSAEDYVRAMWLTLQQPYGDEYIIASGIPHTVRDFASVAFSYVGLNAEDYILQDESAVFSKAVPYIGDPSKIRKMCGWNPLITFNELVHSMVKNEISKLQAEANGK